MFLEIPKWARFEVQIEPVVAEAAFESVVPRLDALPARRLSPVRGDLQLAAAFALDVARRMAEPPVRVRLERLARTGEIDPSCAADLPDVALAAWYVRHRWLLATVVSPPAQLPVALFDEAMALRHRLFDVLERTLVGVPDEAEELSAIRASARCEDFAADLLALHAMYGRHAALLSRVDRCHDHGDCERARELGEEMLGRLAGSGSADARRWMGLSPRAWTLLRRTYEEVRRAGRFLFAADDGDVRFPPLVTLGRGAAYPGE